MGDRRSRPQRGGNHRGLSQLGFGRPGLARGYLLRLVRLLQNFLVKEVCYGHKLRRHWDWSSCAS